MTRRLTVVAHWDPNQEVADHVLRQLDDLATVSDDLVLVTTCALTGAARDAVSARADLVERENVGQDFAGWHRVLQDRWRPGSHDEVFLTNDSYVGYVRPIAGVFGQMAARPVEFWGTHESRLFSRHLQSFFMVFREPVLRSRTWSRFWDRFEPAASRGAAIARQELGLSAALLDAGFACTSQLDPTEEEGELALRRARRRAITAMAQHDPRPARLRPWDPDEPSNPATGLADLVLADGRAPLLKLDVLRYDAYSCGSAHLLTLCEQRYPEAFAGVRDHLKATAWFYDAREHSTAGAVTLSAEEQQTIGYHQPPA